MKKFILGMLTVVIFMPIAESFGELICGWLEVLKIGASKKVLVGNKEIQILQEQLEPVNTQAIGFHIDNEEYYEEDDYEEDKLKTKIGFR